MKEACKCLSVRSGALPFLTLLISVILAAQFFVAAEQLLELQLQHARSFVQCRVEVRGASNYGTKPFAAAVDRE